MVVRLLVGLLIACLALAFATSLSSSFASQFVPENHVNAPASAPVFPLKVGANKHYLVDQNNQPFFMSGDAAWSLIAQGTDADIDDYFNNRQLKGFNTVLINLL